MLTFEKIREMERNERDNKQLQKLPENIIAEIAEYLNRKKKIKEKTSEDITEMENVKKTIERIFEIREHKIADMLLYSIRTGMPVENLISGEEKMFAELMIILKKHRDGFFSAIDDYKEEKIMYRVKASLPEFIGPDMNKYKLSENDIVSIPKPLNDLLMKKGVIEKIGE